MKITEFMPYHVNMSIEYDTPEITLAIRRIICRCNDISSWKEQFHSGDFDGDEELAGFQNLIEGGFFDFINETVDRYTINNKFINKVFTA